MYHEKIRKLGIQHSYFIRVLFKLMFWMMHVNGNKVKKMYNSSRKLKLTQ